MEGERGRSLIRSVDVGHHLVVPGREVAHVSVQLSHRHERVLGKGLRGKRPGATKGKGESSGNGMDEVDRVQHGDG